MGLPILFNSRREEFKKPFGTVKEDESICIHIQIPKQCQAKRVELVVENDQGGYVQSCMLSIQDRQEEYEIWGGEFSLKKGLYYYFFSVATQDGGFTVYKDGDTTRLSSGEKWQISAVTRSSRVPGWAQGAVMYQIFPDRFYRHGHEDLAGKLRPFSLHENWDEEPHWAPDERGRILNNDFFGGNLKGIMEKLEYLQGLGVEILYLNPIVKAFSSHRYDTCDFWNVDPMLGTNDDFKALCDKAHDLGMKVILDGVFSHTGSDSLYFDKERRFQNGAVSNPDSPFRKWYQFIDYPNTYECWWGIDTLPAVNKQEPSYLDFICGEGGGVIGHWLELGADGFRLDVVDELPDAFVAKLKTRMKELKPDALLLGEVWEDASNKIAYGVRRKYFVDGLLDGVMNYPWRTAILQYVLGEDDGTILCDWVMRLAENYPAEVLNSTMLSLSTHDTRRILTALGDQFEGSREEKAARTLSCGELQLAMEREKVAAFLQFFLPGISCIYYGDEAGMQGYEDPFNRRTYPWGKENKDLVDFYRTLAKTKQVQPALKQGDVYLTGETGRLVLRRQWQDQIVYGWINLKKETWTVPQRGKVLVSHEMELRADQFAIAPMGFCAVFEYEDKASD